jgi:hypothetical protein
VPTQLAVLPPEHGSPGEELLTALSPNARLLAWAKGGAAWAADVSDAGRPQPFQLLPLPRAARVALPPAHDGLGEAPQV